MPERGMIPVKKLLDVGLALGLVALAAGSAQAQVASSRSGNSSLRYFGSETAMSELAGFGRCYAKERRKQALSLLAAPPTSRQEIEIYKGLFSGDNLSCLTPGTTLNVPPAYVRGAIAEGLFRAGTGVTEDMILPAPARTEVTSLSDAARCYAARHPVEARALLGTKPASKQEFETVSALMDEFELCLPDGIQINFDATTIRYRVAEALLRLPPAALVASGQ